MRYLAIAIVVHMVVLAWLHNPRRNAPVRETAAASVVVADEAMVVQVLAAEGGGTPAGAPSSAKQRTTGAVPRSSVDAWEKVSISVDRPATGGGGDGNGNGNGNGNGDGNGLGFDGVRIPDDVPATPPPPPTERVSKARPARLIFPSRDRDVEDEADLFIAKVTVDTDGDVVGARMVRTRPGVRGDQASNAIWTFRYLPALNDEGHPITSTFEQPFQIR